MPENNIKTFKALIIEDDPAIRRLIQYHLYKKFDWEIIEAEDGETGLDFIYLKNPDIVYLDLNLPVKSGFDLLREIRSNEDPKIQNIPIIFCSIRNDSDTIRILLDDLKEHGSEYICKPFELEVLYEKTLRTLKRLKAKKKEIFINNEGKGYLSFTESKRESYIRIVDCSGVVENDECSIHIPKEVPQPFDKISHMPVIKIPPSPEGVKISLTFKNTKNAMVTLFCEDI